MIDIYWNRGNKSVRLNPILSDATCEKASDSIGTVTLTIDQEKLTEVTFDVGDNIIIPDPNNTSKVFFRGRIFQIEYSNKDEIEITAYDILKYLQGSKYYVFPTCDLGTRIKVMCADLAIDYGYLAKTPNCKAQLYTDKSYGDILQDGQDYLLYTNGKMYVHRVEDNKIALRDLDTLKTNYLITDRILTDYSYTVSAEDVVNVVEITQKNKDTGEYTKVVMGDKSLMNKLGVLSSTEDADEDLSYAQLVEKARNTLFINKQLKYDLSFTIPAIARLDVFDVITCKIGDQVNYGYISEISWDLIEEETEITLSVLGK